ncbi:MAG: 2-phospho-L-lactate guanylyltransferase [Hyphomicrobiaceae bacterium]|nr:2-phospho-L-lactate guanylyltransferase [Hyphomicrobiaceae bacterium]
MRGIVAVVPVKPLAQSKGRLRVALSPEQRRRLVLQMLADVIAALKGAPRISRVLVVTADQDVAAYAMTRGAEVLAEPSASGLNAGVTRGLEAAQAAGHAAALVLPADLPLATAADIAQLVGLALGSRTPQLAMVPAADGDGTNALLISPPLALAPAFGPGSFLAHLAQALARKIDVRVVHLASLAHDMDRPGDLGHLKGLDRYSFLEEPKLPTGTEILTQ